MLCRLALLRPTAPPALPKVLTDAEETGGGEVGRSHSGPTGFAFFTSTLFVTIQSGKNPALKLPSSECGIVFCGNGFYGPTYSGVRLF